MPSGRPNCPANLVWNRRSKLAGGNCELGENLGNALDIVPRYVVMVRKIDPVVVHATKDHPIA